MIFTISLGALIIIALFYSRKFMNSMYKEVASAILTRLNEDLEGDEKLLKGIIKISRMKNYPWDKERREAKKQALRNFFADNEDRLNYLGIDEGYIVAMTKHPIVDFVPLWKTLVTMCGLAVYAAIGDYLVQARQLMGVGMIWIAIGIVFLLCQIWRQTRTQAVKAYCTAAPIMGVLTAAAKGIHGKWTSVIISGLAVVALIFVIGLIKNLMIKGTLKGQSVQNAERTLFGKITQKITGYETEDGETVLDDIDDEDEYVNIYSSNSLDPEEQRKRRKFYIAVASVVIVILVACVTYVLLNI